MKITKKIGIGLLTAALLVVMFALAGCSSDDDSDLVGVWVWEDNETFITTFNADGTGTHAITWGYGTTFRWSTSGRNIVWNYPDHPNMSTRYNIDGDVLYITVGSGAQTATYRYIRR